MKYHTILEKYEELVYSSNSADEYNMLKSRRDNEQVVKLLKENDELRKTLSSGRSLTAGDAKSAISSKENKGWLTRLRFIKKP